MTEREKIGGRSIQGRRASLGGTAGKILEAIKAHPEGLDIHQIRQLCPEEAATENQFDRRKREIYKYHLIDSGYEGGRYIYRYVRPLTEEERDQGDVSEKDRAKVIYEAHGRCQMCGRTIEADAIKLQADHRIPRDWGGKPVIENLWAICEPCNRGKKNYFKSLDADAMKAILAKRSVHERILLLLRLNHAQPVSNDVIQFVANFEDFQEDWQKRLRELRTLGLAILSSKKKVGRRMLGHYTLTNWVDHLPDDLTATVRAHENARRALKRRNRGGLESRPN